MPYGNELGQLFPGIGTGNKGPKDQQLQGNTTFYPIEYKDVPKDHIGKICFTNVVCEVWPQKADPDHTGITVSGGNISFPGDVVTNIASLELFKLMIDSMLSRRNVKFTCFNISNFYLATPLEQFQCARIRIKDIPQEFFKEYRLKTYMCNA